MVKRYSLTTVLVAVIIAIFIAGNIYINKINTNPIDFTKKNYTHYLMNL